jgi:hypothetical protein
MDLRALLAHQSCCLQNDYLVPVTLYLSVCFDMNGPRCTHCACHNHNMSNRHTLTAESKSCSIPAITESWQAVLEPPQHFELSGCWVFCEHTVCQKDQIALVLTSLIIWLAKSGQQQHYCYHVNTSFCQVSLCDTALALN